MRRRPPRVRVLGFLLDHGRLLLVAGIILLSCVLLSGAPADAAGANLTGRRAPDLTFPGGINGLSAGQRLSQFRGDVVWLKFWVHNCPICLSQMPTAQLRFERWQDFGLQVVTVLNRIDAAHAKRLMTSKGWTVPVALDPRGKLASRYRVKRRPTHYLIGPDGRVILSNRVSDTAITRALGKRRVASVRPVPAGAEAVVQAMRDGHTGTALRLAEKLTDQGFQARVKAAAEVDLRAHARRAKRWLGSNRSASAQQDLRILQTEYVRTSLAALAAQERAAALLR